MRKQDFKIFITIILTILSINSYGQSHPPIILQGVKQQMIENIGGFMADSAFGLPIRGLFPTTNSFIYRKGQEFYDTVNKKIYAWNGINWVKQSDSLDIGNFIINGIATTGTGITVDTTGGVVSITTGGITFLQTALGYTLNLFDDLIPSNTKVVVQDQGNGLLRTASLDSIGAATATYSLSFAIGDSGNSVTVVPLINKQVLQLSIGGSILSPFFFTTNTGKFDFTSIGGVYNTTLIILYKN